ncbi:hypothetical protein OUQ99_18935 [Streptomonospora nanhaiensis]|uniref:PknH-like extracellular domain-containing protein n=1 Tax=Streptomonospora nanhaiensis TaxID=1323731 RepID=A0ABY6YGD0_9ACTN|nr:hypothetical protein [Streptomonospora nanhaiensis]WAE71308.1 hypothetical protein OUQ99_18935 [Streptomonospora nanhaiensis]
MRTSLVLWAGALLAVVGCSTAPAEQTAPRVGEQVADLWVPLDEYSLSRPDLLTVQYAEDLLAGGCMRDAGLPWEPLPPPPEEDSDPLNRKRYGLVEPELAERHGYHPPPPAEDQRTRDRVWQAREALPRDHWTTAYGEDGEGGCLAEARETLRRDVPAVDTTLLNGYIGQTYEASREHPEVVRALDGWSTCMRAEGFDYADPLDANGDPAWAETEEPSDLEITAARTDVRCKEETGLVEVWSAVEEGIQREVIDSHPEDFAGFAQAKEAELDAARSVIARHGPAPAQSDTEPRRPSDVVLGP